MDGILVVNKQSGYTSRDVVNEVCKILNTKKIGHTGTLDPIAKGVLVLCIGKATKLVEILTADEKEYIAEATLGVKTDTLDNTGNIIEEKSVTVTKQQIIDVLNSMIGNYNQEVPIYSAVKIDGKKLYEYARNNISVELPKRNIEIKKIELGEFINENFEKLSKLLIDKIVVKKSDDKTRVILNIYINLFNITYIWDYNNFEKISPLCSHNENYDLYFGN